MTLDEFLEHVIVLNLDKAIINGASYDELQPNNAAISLTLGSNNDPISSALLSLEGGQAFGSLAFPGPALLSAAGTLPVLLRISGPGFDGSSPGLFAQCMDASLAMTIVRVSAPTETPVIKVLHTVGVVTAWQVIDDGRLRWTPMTAAPATPQTGDLAFADGTSWDPGSGAGLYEYHGSAWHKL